MLERRRTGSEGEDKAVPCQPGLVLGLGFSTQGLRLGA